jgi:hypothetical protein
MSGAFGITICCFTVFVTFLLCLVISLLTRAHSAETKPLRFTCYFPPFSLSSSSPSLCMKRLRGGGLGELLHWGPWKMCRESLWIWASLWGHLSSRGEPRLSGGLYTVDFVRWMEEGSLTGEPERWGFWETCKIPCRRASLSMGAMLGDLEGVVCWDFWEIRKVYLGTFIGPRFIKIRALVVGHLSVRDSIKGTLREDSCTGQPERWGFWELCKMPCRRTSLFIGALLGNLEGVHLLGLLRDNKSISGFLFGPGGH